MGGVNEFGFLLVLYRFVTFFVFCFLAVLIYVHLEREKGRMFKVLYVLCFCVASMFIFTHSFWDDANDELQSFTSLSEQTEPSKKEVIESIQRSLVVLDHTQRIETLESVKADLKERGYSIDTVEPGTAISGFLSGVEDSLKQESAKLNELVESK